MGLEKSQYRDEKKDKRLDELGVTVLRFDDLDVRHKLDKVLEAIDYLKSKDLTYGKDGALWFRSQKLGDDKDRVLKRKDGQFTYFASDIAYHLDKFDRGYNKIIDLWGADHFGYVDVK